MTAEQLHLEPTVWDRLRALWRAREATFNVAPCSLDFVDACDDGAVITFILRLDGWDDHRKMTYRDDVSIARAVADVWKASGRT